MHQPSLRSIGESFDTVTDPDALFRQLIDEFEAQERCLSTMMPTEIQRGLIDKPMDRVSAAFDRRRRGRPLHRPAR
jgi:hypothetical protein